MPSKFVRSASRLTWLDEAESPRASSFARGAGRIVEVRADQFDVAIPRGSDRVELAVEIAEGAHRVDLDRKRPGYDGVRLAAYLSCRVFDLRHVCLLRKSLGIWFGHHRRAVEIP